MKKTIPAAILLVAIAVTAFLVVKRAVVHRPRAAELVPAETILFAQIPDTVTTVQRFTGTALCRILQEPEMQEFLESMKVEGSLLDRWAKTGERVLRILPREAFAAVTSIDAASPTFVAGFAFSGRQKDAEALVTEWRTELRKGRPTGKADLMSYGSREIETFTDKDFTLAEVFCGGWYFIANNLELLQRTIDRLEGKTDLPSLANSDTYKQVTAPLPSSPDALFVAQLGTAMDRVTALMIAAGQKSDPAQLEELKKTKAIAGATKFEGEQCRDTIFVLRPGGANEAPLARNAIALTSPATLLYYATKLPQTIDLSEQSVPLLALVPGWDSLSKALADKNLVIGDLTAAFGPELGTVLDWPAGADSPSVLLAFDVRDRAKALAFVDVITDGQLGGTAWTRSEQDGATLLSMPSAELSMISPSVAVTQGFAIIGLNGDTVTKTLARVGQAHLESTPAYAQSAKSVTAPTSGFGYIDLQPLFERTYGVLKPLLAMSFAMSPDGTPTFDAGKLPPAETISKHLGPIVYSQATTEQGTIVESTGPVTFNQLLVGAVAGVVSAALPTMQAALSSGSLLDPAQLFQGLGGSTVDDLTSNPPPEGSKATAPDANAEPPAPTVPQIEDQPPAEEAVPKRPETR